MSITRRGSDRRSGPRLGPHPHRRRARVRRRPAATVRAAPRGPPATPPRTRPGDPTPARVGSTSCRRRRQIREADWSVAPAPADLDDRRVEITGPAEPKMMINALNSGARVFMADLEDALSPTWANVVGGQAALADAVRGTLAFESPEGKSYRLGERLATLLVRPRGWHLVESHVLVDGKPMSGLAVRRRAVPVPQRRRAPAARDRAVLLPRQARVAPRGAPVERGVRPRPGSAGHPARLGPGDRPDRDDPRRVRDGRDPVRAARARRRAQRRSLGLPVQLRSRRSATSRTSRCRIAPS